MANSDRTTGIDLPQKMAIWQDLFGDVYLSYNAPSYLQSRHRITSAASPQLSAAAEALANLASAATGREVPKTFRCWPRPCWWGTGRHRLTTNR